MSSVQSLRDFVNNRLTVATEEILGVFEQTVRVYEEEINRQRKLLDMVLKPEIKLHRTEILQSACNDHVRPDQQFCNEQRNSSLDQENPEPPQIKQEQEEQLKLGQGSKSFNLRPPGKGSDYSEDQTLLLDPLLLTDISVEVIKTESDTEHCDDENGDHHLVLSPHRTESQDHERENQERTHTDQTLENKYFKCHFCAEEFHDILELKTHRRTHLSKKSFKCNTCGKEFSRKQSVWRHMNIHTGAKPFRCGVCGKEFNCQSNCATHMKTHTGEKPHLCVTCGKRFSQVKYLRTHIRSHTGEKPYSCVHCGRGFATRSHLTDHIRVHTGERPYSCAWCGRRFAVSSSLKKHTRLHTGEKPYECQICGKNFTQSTSLILHKRIHAKEKQQS